MDALDPRSVHGHPEWNIVNGRDYYAMQNAPTSVQGHQMHLQNHEQMFQHGPPAEPAGHEHGYYFTSPRGPGPNSHGLKGHSHALQQANRWGLRVRPQKARKK